MRNIQRERQALKTWLERSAGRDLSLTVWRQIHAGKHRGYVDLRNGRLASFRNAKMDPVLYDERQGLGRDFMLFLERSKRISVEGNKAIISRVVRAPQRLGSSLETPYQGSAPAACGLEFLSLKFLHGPHTYSITMDISRLLPPLKRLCTFRVSTGTEVIGEGQEVLVVSPAPAFALCCADGREDRDNAMGYGGPVLRELIFDRVYWMSKRQMVKWMVCFPELEKMEVGLDLNPEYSIPAGPEQISG